MVDLNDIYQIGTDLRWIRSLSNTALVHGSGWVTGNLGRIKKLFIQLGDTDSATSIQYYINDLSKKYKENDKIENVDVDDLNQKGEIWHDRIHNLLKKKKIFEISPNCTLNIELLISGVSNFFEKKYWDNFGDITKHDLEEASKCILLSAPTAAAMLLLRAVEGVLREYYKKKSGKDVKDSPGFLDWSDILKELGCLPLPNRGLLDHLNYLRLNLRNPSSHPDKIFTSKEAENLFGTVVNTIEEMCKEIY